MPKLELTKLPEKGTITFTLRIPASINVQLEEIAKETGISKNAIVNKMIHFGLNNLEIKK